jgi:predicted metal-dependent enzyme (double-stranded beta helix superfamily)
MTDSRTERLAPLRQFLSGMTQLVARPDLPECARLDEGSILLQRLLAQDDWLDDQYAAPHPEYYRQYLLYCDPLERFSVVSFVWGPGQRTPIHNHTVWGLIGMLRGAEDDCRFEPASSGLSAGETCRLMPGMIGRVSTHDGDIHQVSNAYPDRVSVSIHVYGGNIGRIGRSVFDPVTGEAKPFVSSYANATLPNAWQ